MKKFLFILLLANPLFGSGPKNRFDDASLNDELINVYKDIRNPIINYGTASTMTVTNLTVTTCTGCSGSSGSSVTTSTLTVTSSTTLKGTATNDSAAAGNIGEYIESVVSGVSVPASGNNGNLTSINLTAGDWDVTSLLLLEPNGATTTEVETGITSSATGIGTVGNNRMDCPMPVAATRNAGCSVPVVRISINTTTTYYLNLEVTYSAATPKGDGRLSARRVR